VPSAVMPKGVEHGWAAQLISGLSFVPSAVMPKGVEHAPTTGA
jgi:hypothetical protein